MYQDTHQLFLDAHYAHGHLFDPREDTEPSHVGDPDELARMSWNISYQSEKQTFPDVQVEHVSKTHRFKSRW